MTYEVGVVAHFTASHHLVGDFGPASLPHSHAYRVQIGAGGASLRADGTLFDITYLQQALAAAIAEVEGRDLNDLAATLAGVAAPNPTAEVLARFFFERIASALAGQGVATIEAWVWESDEAYASYRGDLA